MNYVPLWIKTDYSILTSLIKIDDLIKSLLSLNINTVGICDDNLFGAMEFYTKCKQNNIKPIIGLEINLEYKVLLYAKDYKGYQNLCNIDTLKNEDKLIEEVLFKYLDNLLIVLPYEYSIYKDKFFDYQDDLFIGYSTNEEKNKIDGNKVYVKKTLSLKKEDEKYLKYLYKLNNKDFEESLVTLEDTIDNDDKKTTLFFENKCNLIIDKKDDLLPLYDVHNSYEYLTKLCIVGLKKRLNNLVSNKYVNRLKYELEVINKMGFCNYFLIVWDYVKYAKKNNIMVGPGRGSAASSLVSYSLGITDIDPLKYDLLFERFLNPDRVTMPDIDIDFDASKRDDVIKYVINKYGNDKVCGIITFSNLLAKQVIRDVARLFDVSLYKVDNLLKNFEDKKDLKYQLNNVNVKRIIQNDEELKKVYDISMHLEGLKRHTSSHAAGIIISNKELKDYVPLSLNTDGSYLCGYTMNYIENLGLLKMDFLGIKNLTMIDKITNKVGASFNDIPLDDIKTYKLFSNGLTNGVFQFESTGMKRFLTDLKPENINDLIAAVALFRPGPIDNIPTYVKRKNKKEKVQYIHPDLEPILKDTYGIIIYQEQIMQIASKIAGFTFSLADNLRRAMSKKKENLLLSYKEKFIDGGMQNGYDKSLLEDIYNLILKFANYGFNKAHSVCYAIIGYKIAYLKVHYPKEFMCEELNNSIGLNAKTKVCINESKRLGIEIKKPSINTSSYEYKISDGKIEYSLAMVKGIGTLICRQIEEERKKGSFKSYLDVVLRLNKLGRSIIENLILSGCLDEFGLNKKTMMNNLDEAFNYADLAKDLDESLIIKPEIKEYDEYTNEELTKFELDLYGLYLTNHPTNKYISENSVTTNMINGYFDKNIKMILYFEKKRVIDTKNNDKMMFITASDSFGSIDLVIFPKEYERFFNLKLPSVYEVYGKVEKRLSKIQMVVSNIKKIEL